MFISNFEDEFADILDKGGFESLPDDTLAEALEAESANGMMVRQSVRRCSMRVPSCVRWTRLAYV